MLCHTFPQERPTGRSGTASAGSDKSADAEVPSFSRKISWRLGRFFTAGAGRFYQPTGALSIRHRGAEPPLSGRCPYSGRPGLGLQSEPLALLYCSIGVPKVASRVHPQSPLVAAHGNSGDILFRWCNDKLFR
jgi:hypothetical protein